MTPQRAESESFPREPEQSAHTVSHTEVDLLHVPIQGGPLWTFHTVVLGTI